MTFGQRFTVGLVAVGALVGYALLVRDILSVSPSQARALAEAERRFAGGSR
jgi:hypothetical protein